VTAFVDVPEQAEAKRLLESSLADGEAHAFLFHGPRGVGKRSAARAFAGTLLGDPRRVDAGTHPDLRVIEALGEMIRIDEIRALHHDLHMRPFEADRRVYLLLDAHLLNDEAAAALLKDLEEPPEYATLVLVADELGPLPETIRSRCQLVPFRRLSRAAVERWVAEQAPELSADETALVARVAGGRLDRAARLLDPDARERRTELLRVARAVYLDPELDAAAAAAVVVDATRARGAAARERELGLVDGLDLPAREAEQRVKRVEFGAEKEELLASLEDLAAWYRDLVVVAAGADAPVVHADRLAELREDAPGREAGAEAAAAAVRQAWREVEEFNLNASLLLEALFVRIRRAFD
jgi:DNA polymerase-3 subunit delta'